MSAAQHCAGVVTPFSIPSRSVSCGVSPSGWRRDFQPSRRNRHQFPHAHGGRPSGGQGRGVMVGPWHRPASRPRSGLRSPEQHRSDGGGRRPRAQAVGRRAPRGGQLVPPRRRADGPAAHRAGVRPAQPGRRASTARPAPGPIPRPATGTSPSSASPGPRRSRGRPPSVASTGSSSPGTPSADLDEQSEWWLGQQGRLTEPMHLRAGRHALHAGVVGRGQRDHGPATCTALPIAGRRGVLHLRAAPATRPPSSTS